MKIAVYWGHNWEYAKDIEVNTFEDLLKFKEECGCDIVIINDINDNSKPAILIYDDYIE